MCFEDCRRRQEPPVDRLDRDGLLRGTIHLVEHVRIGQDRGIIELAGPVIGIEEALRLIRRE